MVVERLITHAKQGDRILIDGKGVWAGLGNRSGLHSFVGIALSDAWDRRGARFVARLEKSVGVATVLRFSNITRDRGRWVPIAEYRLKERK